MANNTGKTRLATLAGMALILLGVYKVTTEAYKVS